MPANQHQDCENCRKGVPCQTHVILVDDSDTEHIPQACGILGRFPILSILFFAILGIGIGVGLSFWEPEDMNTKDTVLQWLGLVGDLFIRALKCVVLPLVFVNVIIAVVEMAELGKAGAIGYKTIFLYLATTVCAAVLGILSTLALKGQYTVGEFGDPEPVMISLGCNMPDGLMLETADGNLECSANYTEDDPSVYFTVKDLGSNFVMQSSGPSNDISLSDTVYDGVFLKLVTDNITKAFTTANFAAVVVFAVAFGAALSRVIDRRRSQGQTTASLMNILQDLDAVLLILINWIIMVTPFAVFSLIIKAVGSQENLKEAFANVGFLVMATIIAMILQFLLVYVGAFALVTKSNPFDFLQYIVPAQTMAFASASSAATIPLTLKSVLSTGRVPEAIARFVVPLGATVNMDGGAIYFPCACIWLAVLNGIQPSVASYILLVVISTIGSIGTAPVPSASLVLIITAYNTVFNTTGTPNGFSFIIAIDWFMDRLRTTLNVTGDTIVSGMVAHLCPLVSEDEVQGESGRSPSKDPSDHAEMEEVDVDA